MCTVSSSLRVMNHRYAASVATTTVMATRTIIEAFMQVPPYQVCADTNATGWPSGFDKSDFERSLPLGEVGWQRRLHNHPLAGRGTAETQPVRVKEVTVPRRSL